jgi:ABC-type glycerol-3-phosphate transport system substrate-binding protein
MPSFTGQPVKMGGYMTTWAVLKDAPSREAGIQLLQFISRPAVAQQWVHDTKSPTGLKGDFYDSVFGQDIHAAYQRTLHENGSRLLSDPSESDGSFGTGYPFIDAKRVKAAVQQLEQKVQE